MDKELVYELIDEAKDIAKSNTCCKYSNFTVGVALLTKDGKIYKGFNVENDGIQSICAERVAFSKALTEGNKEFHCLAVVGKNLSSHDFRETLPCGYCRQFISEYGGKDFIVYTYDDTNEEVKSYSMQELLPYSFRKEDHDGE